jgi:hypothetical protein
VSHCLGFCSFCACSVNSNLRDPSPKTLVSSRILYLCTPIRFSARAATDTAQTDPDCNGKPRGLVLDYHEATSTNACVALTTTSRRELAQRPIQALGGTFLD